MSAFADAVDTLVEAPIVTSFTRAGYALRSRLDDWRDLSDYDVTDRVVVVTGATSGLGLAAARRLAAAGATLVVIGRNPDKTTTICRDLAEEHGTDVIPIIADMGELEDVRRAAKEILADRDRIDVLIHNAGALTDLRRDNSEGIEVTVASQVVGPFLLTSLLLDAVDAARGRVITMSSGGMYATGLAVSSLQMAGDDYKGSEQYARAKRAQVTLNEMWAEREAARDVVFHALHPGWADTPGVEAALPTFRRIVGPALRTADEGADTMVWLAVDDEPLATSGAFWLDRRPRPIHKLPTTRRTDTPDRREALWDWVSEAAGLS